MITDKIKNINKYGEIPNYIKEFVLNLPSNINDGRIKINDCDYANVESYITKTHDKCMFEAHEKFADIQIILSGEERLDFSDKKYTIVVPYNNEKDIKFVDAEESETIILDGSNFVMLFPEELHRPQMCINKPEQVKKIVVKVKM